MKPIVDVAEQRSAMSANGALLAVLAAIAVAPLPAHAEDRADIDKTQIIGNRELPKVLYIVPWKKPLPGDLNGRPTDSLLDDALTPIDRDVFRRQIRYSALTGNGGIDPVADTTAVPVPAPAARGAALGHR